MSEYYSSPQDNNTTVSPLTGNILDSGRRNPIQIIFSPKEFNEQLSGINTADLIFEYINEKGRTTYNAIYYDNIPAKASPIKMVEDISINNLPQLSFSENLHKRYENNKSATYIFVTTSHNISSNFIFENGLYKHFKDKSMDIDISDSQPILVSNVIVQFTDNYGGIENLSNPALGSGMLFCGGRIIDIKWKNDGTSPIKIEDENGNPVFLQTGKTWWIIVNEKCPVAYN